MHRLIEKDNFTFVEPIISNQNGLNNDFLKKSVLSFYDEMDFYINENEDYDFWQCQVERTFLSMFLNSIIRSDTKRQVTILQEYAVWQNKKSKGRCDAFINYNKNAILIESKRDFNNLKIKDKHWDIEEWLQWDESMIGGQLNNYYIAQKDFLCKPTYNSCQLMTLVFKLVSIRPNKHLAEMEGNLCGRCNESYSRGWFYTFLFGNDKQMDSEVRGLEVYGTIKTINE